jgi:dCTP diphosphatase
MNTYQRAINEFSQERDWTKFHNPKDLLLGIVEEVGEIRNLIKWEQDPAVLNKVLNDHRDRLEDDIGDLYWFLALLANSADIDLDEAISKVIAKNRKRFPTKDVASKHTNLFLGGKDGQYRQ